MLSSGAGRLVRLRRLRGAGRALSAGSSKSPRRWPPHASEAARIGATFGWPSIAEATADRPARGRARPPRGARRSRMRGLELLDVRTDHLLTLVDDCGDHPARERRDPEPLHRLLRRRRRAARRSSRSSSSGAPATASGRPCSTARWRSSPTRATTTAGMRNFMSYDRQLARRAARRRPRRPRDLGARRRARRPPGCRRSSTRRSDLLAALVRSLDGRPSLRTAAYTALGLAAARSRPPRRPTRASCSSAASTSSTQAYETTSGDGWSWFEDSLSLRQRPPAAGADPRRRRARATQRAVAAGLAVARVARRRVRSRATACCGCPATKGAAATSRRPASATSSRSTRPRSSRPSCRRSPSRATSTTASRAQRAFDWFLGRNRLGRPLYDFATGGCCDGLGADDVERERRRRVDARVPSRAARARRRRRCRASCAPPASPRSRRDGRARARSAAIPATRSSTAADWPHSVNAVFNPAAVEIDGETVLLAPGRGSHRDLAPHRRALCQRHRRLAGRAEPLLAPADGHEERAVGLRGPARRLGRRARPLRDHLHRVRPGRPGRLPRDDRETSARSSGSGSSSRPRTRTPRSCPSGSTADGSSSTARRPASAARRRESSLSRSADLRELERAREGACDPRAGAWWDSLRIGIGPPLLKTEHGWLLVYHGVKETVSGAIYRRRARAARSRRSDAACCAARRTGCSAPREPYERSGDVPNAIFPCGIDPRPRRAESCGSTTAPPTRRSASRPPSSTKCSTRCSPRRPTSSRLRSARARRARRSLRRSRRPRRPDGRAAPAGETVRRTTTARLPGR